VLGSALDRFERQHIFVVTVQAAWHELGREFKELEDRVAGKPTLPKSWLHFFLRRTALH
jgi:hypothetical protein